MAEEVKKRRGRPPWTEEQKEAFRKKKAEAEAAGKPIKYGPGGRHNFPQMLGIGESEEDKAMISRLIGEARLSFKMPKPKNDDELERRIQDYFELCETRGMIPTVEEMSMFMGYSRQYMNEVRRGKAKGFSPRTKDIFDRVADFMAAFDAKLAMTGKIRDAVYIFRSKNYHDMKDQQEVTFTANTNTEQEMSREDLESWLLEDGKKVEVHFKEDEPSSKG